MPAAPKQLKQLPWESQPFFLAQADEKNRDVIVEEGLEIPLEMRQQQVTQAHEFLGQNGIELNKPEIDPLTVRDIDNFDINRLRPNAERHNRLQVSNNTAADVREFPADNT